MGENLSQETQLLEAHAQALNELRAARRIAILAPFVLLVALVGALWWKVAAFTKYDAPKVPGMVAKKLPEHIKPLADAGMESVAKLAPVYRDAIAKVMERDREIYLKLVASQTAELLEYGAGLQEGLKTRFDDLMKQVLREVEDKLAAGMSVEETREFEALVAMRLYELLGEEVEKNWSGHMRKLEDVCASLYAVSLSTAEVDNAKPMQMVGVGLELLGLYLQQNNFDL